MTPPAGVSARFLEAVRDPQRAAQALARRGRVLSRRGRALAWRRVRHALAVSTPYRVDRAMVLDGRTLQLAGTHAGPSLPSDSALRLRSRRSSAAHAVPVAVAHDRFTATVVLDAAGLSLEPGTVWDVSVRAGRRTFPLRFPGESATSGPTLRNPLSAVDGIRREVRSSARETLQLRISHPQPGVHVERVDVTFGTIHLVARAILEVDEEPGEVVFEQRGGELRVQTPVGADRQDVNTAREVADWLLHLTFPVQELAHSASPITHDLIWDIHLDTSHGPRDLTKFLGDLRRPGRTFRYPTTVLTDRPRRDRLRPYWTKDGRLAVEHMVSPAPTTTT